MYELSCKYFLQTAGDPPGAHKTQHILFEAGRSLQLLGKPQQATKLLRKAFALVKGTEDALGFRSYEAWIGSPEIWERLGDHFSSCRDDVLAIDCYQVALEIGHERKPGLLMSYALSLYTARRVHEAMKVAEEAAATDEKVATVLAEKLQVWRLEAWSKTFELNWDEVENAAIAIQSKARQKLARKKVKERRDTVTHAFAGSALEKIHLKAAAALNSPERKALSSTEMSPEKNKIKALRDKREEEDYERKRVEMEVRKLEITPEHQTAVLKMQAITRGKSGRKRAKLKRVESKSAIKIQAVTRGKKDRKRVNELKEQERFEKIFVKEGTDGERNDRHGDEMDDSDSIAAMFKKVSWVIYDDPSPPFTSVAFFSCRHFAPSHSAPRLSTHSPRTFLSKCQERVWNHIVSAPSRCSHSEDMLGRELQSTFCTGRQCSLVHGRCFLLRPPCGEVWRRSWAPIRIFPSRKRTARWLTPVAMLPAPSATSNIDHSLKKCARWQGFLTFPRMQLGRHPTTVLVRDSRHKQSSVPSTMGEETNGGRRR